MLHNIDWIVHIIPLRCFMVFFGLFAFHADDATNKLEIVLSYMPSAAAQGPGLVRVAIGCETSGA